MVSGSNSHGKNQKQRLPNLTSQMKAAMNAAFICNDTEPFKEYGIRVCKHGVERVIQFVVLFILQK